MNMDTFMDIDGYVIHAQALRPFSERRLTREIYGPWFVTIFDGMSDEPVAVLVEDYDIALTVGEAAEMVFENWIGENL